MNTHDTKINHDIGVAAPGLSSFAVQAGVTLALIAVDPAVYERWGVGPIALAATVTTIGAMWRIAWTTAPTLPADDVARACEPHDPDRVDTWA